jgi:3-phenylpropionate/trans-cinnamate dioxygenase ferredoxin reductase subunit
VGGGWSGLEVASAARTAGCEVVVLEALDLPLVRVLGPEVAEVFRALHVEHGVDLRTNVSVTSIDGQLGQAAVGLADGSSITAALLVVGVGVTHNGELAEAAGLATDNGVVVDQHLRTSHPDVCRGRRRTRLPPCARATSAGRALGHRDPPRHTAARNLLDTDVSYTRLL